MNYTDEEIREYVLQYLSPEELLDLLDMDIDELFDALENVILTDYRPRMNSYIKMNAGEDTE